MKYTSSKLKCDLQKNKTEIYKNYIHRSYRGNIETLINLVEGQKGEKEEL